MTADSTDIETAIANLVRGFYDRARLDPLIGPVFETAVGDWEAHFAIAQDFWSNVLLGTGRYHGSPFAPHLRLPIETPEFFDRWLELFGQTATEVLPPELAHQALDKARHMGECLKVGLFPYKLPDGSMSRRRP